MKVIKGVVKAVMLIVCVALVASAAYLAYIFVTSGFNTSAVEHEVEVIMVKAESIFSEQAGSIEDKAESVSRAFENVGDKAEEAIGSISGKVGELVESVGDKVGGD